MASAAGSSDRPEAERHWLCAPHWELVRKIAAGLCCRLSDALDDLPATPAGDARRRILEGYRDEVLQLLAAKIESNKGDHRGYGGPYLIAMTVLAAVSADDTDPPTTRFVEKLCSDSAHAYICKGGMVDTSRLAGTVKLHMSDQRHVCRSPETPNRSRTHDALLELCADLERENVALMGTHKLDPRYLDALMVKVRLAAKGDPERGIKPRKDVPNESNDAALREKLIEFFHQFGTTCRGDDAVSLSGFEEDDPEAGDRLLAEDAEAALSAASEESMLVRLALVRAWRALSPLQQECLALTINREPSRREVRAFCREKRLTEKAFYEAVAEAQKALRMALSDQLDPRGDDAEGDDA